MTIRTIIVTTLLFVLIGCESNSKIEDKPCKVDSILEQNYKRDISNVIEFYSNPRMDTYDAYRSFMNLEILSNDSINLDDLRYTFFDTNLIEDNLKDYTNKWRNANKCFSIAEAQQKFNEIKDRNFNFDYKDKDFLRELRMSYSFLIEDSSLSRSVQDSILTYKHQKFVHIVIPGWDD